MHIASFRRLLKREIDKVNWDRFQSNNWFDLWHTHVDWRSRGKESPAHRQAELRAIFQLHDRIRECMNDFGKPFQQWIMISQADPGQDSVYVHSENPQSPFPARFANVDWSAKIPSWLAEHIHTDQHRVGRFRSASRLVEFVVEDVNGRNRPIQ